MADAQVRPLTGILDKRQGRSAATTQVTNTFANNVKDIASMRARLTAISGTTYTTARLDTMTANDMMYAIRVNDEPTSI
jgi:hypothetical protein